MTEGYVKLYRKSVHSSVFQNAMVWRFWCWCLTKASHKETTVMIGFTPVNIHAGQFVFGRKVAAKELKTSERKTRTCLSTLIKLGNMTSKTTNRYTVLTVVNWGIYQDRGNKNDQQATNERPTSDHIQEVKEVKEGKEKENTRVSFWSPEYQSLKVQAMDVLNHLNAVCRKSYPSLPVNLRKIIDRLCDGYAPEVLKRVIDIQEADKDFKREWLSPSTLFEEEKFQNYIQKLSESKSGFDVHEFMKDVI